MAASLPDWMLLERFVFYRDIAAFPDSEAAPFRADGTSSHDGSFSVALRIRNPPDISRLYLQWPTGPKGGSPCVLVAAHRNLLLFKLTPKPVTLNKAPFVDFRQDHFICGAQSSPSQPLLLRKIPKCDIPELVSVTNGKDVTVPRLFDLNPVSILCRGEEEFALAQLNFRRSKDNKWGELKAELCVLRSKVTNPRQKWKTEKCLPIQYEAHERFDLENWRTDRIIAFNKHLCWVNYGGGGILFCELFQQKPPIFYLRLPILNRCFHERPPALHETNRSVSVTRGSMGCEELRFIDIVRKDGNLIGPLGSGDMEGFTITCHALRVTESGAMEWDMLFFITCYELWNANPSLPHAPLKHPVVSMSDPNVVHFLMSEHLPQIIDKVSAVSVDMRTRKVLSTNAYINGKEDLKGQDADMVQKNAHYLQTFLPSELPKFLKPDQVK